ncbi:hypothetical protein CEXT_596751 [Caerostris extrusa]|uniref:Uncharacterized protein n=1 Tax=Caerostris extrusa TaxID=172846 RepID=A0AAV4UAZ1_CAEEX|nr:hypothetical protein CEXT_596751 [Caerostris extrusa]
MLLSSLGDLPGSHGGHERQNALQRPPEDRRQRRVHLLVQERRRQRLYKLDARSRSLGEASHVRNETYRNRVKFYLTATQPYLQLDP